MTESRPLCIGLLGASRIADLAVFQAIEHTGDIAAAVAARDPQRAARYAAEHQIPVVYDSYEALIDDASLDLIYISLPNGLHAHWAIRALDAGRSVLVEKPAAANVREFAQIEQALERSTGWFFEAFHYADHAATAKLRSILSGNEPTANIGEIQHIEIRMRTPAPPSTDPRWSFELAGGAMMDLGCYAINMLLNIAEWTGLNVTLQGASGTAWSEDHRVDAAIASTWLLGSAPVRMDVNMDEAAFDYGLTVTGASGSVYLPIFAKPQDDDRVVITVDGIERALRVGTRPSYAYQLDRVRGELQRGERRQTELQRSRRTIELIDAVYDRAGFPLRPTSTI